jgi:hypothetical protein
MDPIQLGSLDHLSLRLFSTFCPCSYFRQEYFWVRNFDCGFTVSSSVLLGSCLSTGGELWVFSPHCWAFHLRSLWLSPKNLWSPRSLVFTRGFLHLPLSEAAYFHSFFWPSWLLPRTPPPASHQYLILFFPFPLLSYPDSSFLLSPMIIFFPLLHVIETFLLDLSAYYTSM